MSVQGFEIYKLVGGGYKYRKIIDFAFSEDEAKTLVTELAKEHGRLHYGKIYFEKIDGVWRRFYVSDLPKAILDKLNEK